MPRSQGRRDRPRRGRASVRRSTRARSSRSPRPGTSARLLARYRSPMPILAFTPIAARAPPARAVLGRRDASSSPPVAPHRRHGPAGRRGAARARATSRTGDAVVIVAGGPPGIPGSTNAHARPPAWATPCRDGSRRLPRRLPRRDRPTTPTPSAPDATASEIAPVVAAAGRLSRTVSTGRAAVRRSGRGLPRDLRGKRPRRSRRVGPDSGCGTGCSVKARRASALSTPQLISGSASTLGCSS